MYYSIHLDNYVSFVCGFLLICNFGDSARILGIFPVPLKSFFYYNEAILKSLHKAGHQIVFVNPFPEIQPMENYTVVDSRFDSFVFVGQTSVDHFSGMSTRKFAKMMIDLEEKYCDNVMRLQVIQDALSGIEKYDVIFIGMIQMYECYLNIAEELNIPVIGTVNYRSWMSERAIGNPFNPAVVPLVWSSHGRSMTFQQRLINTWNIFMNDFLYTFVVSPKLDRFNWQHFPNSSAVKAKPPALMFINSHLTLQSRPMVPNAIEIGGIHIEPEKSLPKDLQKFINDAEHGVILFSFGSVMNTSTLPAEVKTALVHTFASIPQRVIWKFEERISGISDNVFISSWIPQRDILEHRNVKAFISHCGLAGIYEAIYTGTPIIGIPFFCDQRSNAALLVDLGVAVRLDVTQLTKENLLNTLNTIMNDTRYHAKMQELSRVFKDRPMTPRESVIYWTDYVIRHNGAPHLLTAAADMPLYQYLLLDVILLAVTVIITVFWMLFYILRRIISRIRRWQSKNDRIDNKKRI